MHDMPVTQFKTMLFSEYQNTDNDREKKTILELSCNFSTNQEAK